jgi:transposase
MRTFNLKQIVREVETRAITRVLIETDYNKKEAARRLGLERTTLVEKCKRYGIALPQWRGPNIMPATSQEKRRELTLERLRLKHEWFMRTCALAISEAANAKIHDT